MVRRSNWFSLLCLAFFGSSLLAMMGSAAAQTGFQSSNGRFTAQVPPEWNIAEDVDQGQVTFSHGNLSVSLGVAPTENGQTPPASGVLDGIIPQFKSQCRSAEVVKHG